MTKEFYWLTCTAILTGILWVPYILDRAMVRGLVGSMANPSPELKPQAAWAQRLQAAHYNTVENLVVFAVLVLILNAIHVSTANTVMACAIFFWSRLAYVIVYAAGIPGLRTLAFVVGFAAQVSLALAILGAM